MTWTHKEYIQMGRWSSDPQQALKCFLFLNKFSRNLSVFLKHLDDNFMVQVLRELTWKDAFLDSLLVNREDLVILLSGD